MKIYNLRFLIAIASFFSTLHASDLSSEEESYDNALAVQATIGQGGEDIWGEIINNFPCPKIKKKLTYIIFSDHENEESQVETVLDFRRINKKLKEIADTILKKKLSFITFNIRTFEGLKHVIEKNNISFLHDLDIKVIFKNFRIDHDHLKKSSYYKELFTSVKFIKRKFKSGKEVPLNIFSNLHTLDISQSFLSPQLQPVIVPIENSIKNLDVSACSLKMLGSFFNNFKNVQNLNLSFNPLEDTNSFTEKFPNLKKLTVTGTTRVHHLDIQGKTHVEFETLVHLAQLPGLKTLIVQGKPQVSDIELERLLAFDTVKITEDEIIN